MSRYIGLYVKTCDLCMRTKLQHRRPHGELYPMETPEEQWDTITVDFVVELPDAHGYDAIMNIVNSVRKRAHFMPMHTMVNMEGAAWLYLKKVWKLHGLPCLVRSDCRLQFVTDFTTQTVQAPRDQAHNIHSIPPTDGWPDRACQPGDGAVPTSHCE